MSALSRLWSGVVLLALVTACAGGSGSGGETTGPGDAAVLEPSTTIEVSTSTTGSGPDVPAVLVANEAGLVVWEGGELRPLVVGRTVQAAFPDLVGGVVYQDQSQQISWLRAGESDPVVAVDPVEGIGIHLADVAVVGGRPVVVYELWDCRSYSDCWADLMVRDLASGVEHSMGVIGGFESGPTAIAVGGERILEVWGDYGGCCDFAFLSITFESDEELINPCSNGYRCYDGAISPDGSMLAYTRPGFTEGSEHQPPPGTELIIADLNSGDELSRTVNDGSVLDFDGAWILVGSDGDPAGLRLSLVSLDGVVHDLPVRGFGRLWRDAEVAAPAVTLPEPAVPRGPVDPNERMVAAETMKQPWWTVILDSIPVAGDTWEIDTGWLDVQEIADVARRREIPTGVLWSDDYVTLNPGYQVVYSGFYTTREEAAARCEALRPLVGSCYPRYVATAETIDPEIGRGMIELRADGLGLVDFGDSVEEVVDLLTALFGPVSSDWEVPPVPTSQECFKATGYSCDDYFRVVAWDQVGLSALFSDQVYLRTSNDPPFVPDGFPHFAGWLVEGGTGARLTTPERISVGSSVQELREVYGEEALGFSTCQVEPPIGWYVVFSGYRGYLSGDQSNPDVVLTGLRSGIRPNC